MDRTKHLFSIAGAVLLLALIASPGLLLAQNIVTGGVTGTVTDPSGGVIANATVTIKNAVTSETNTVSTSDSGIYLFSFLKPGEYTLSVAQKGFRTLTSKIQVQLGQTASANLKLELGDASETIEVSTGVALLQTEDANISTTIGSKSIENVPNPGGDLSYIAQIAPGTTINSSSGGGFGNFSSFGLPGTANLFTINGNDYNDPFLNLNNSGASNLLLGSNEIQETAVVSNGYTGQYGRQAGAQVDYSTKSGSNAYHGDAQWYWNGRYLNANDFFANSGGVARPFENNNQWAAAIGGPIKKDKAFFFVNTEGIRYDFGTGNSLVFAPTPAFQAFTLANLASNSPSSIPFYNKIFNLYNSANGISRATAAANSCPASVLGAPATATSPAVPGVPGAAAAFPTGACLESFRTSSPNGNTEWLLSVRGDYEFGPNDKVFGRVKFDRGRQPTYTDPINPLFNEQSVQPSNEGQLNYTHSFSPSVVNNFIGSVLNYSAIFQPANLGTALNAFPFALVSTDSSLYTLGSGAGFTIPGANSPFPQGRNVTQWQIVDDLSINRGSHAFKLGVTFRRDDVTDFTASQGEFPVVATTLGAFSEGLVDSNIAKQFSRVGGSEPLAFYSLGLYFQDEYRVNSKLKLTLTLRADRNSGGACQRNCGALSVVPFDQASHDAATPYNQLIQTGRHGILRDVEKFVFQPRIGFAYSPGNQKTVFRGGVGLFTDLYPGTILNNYTRNFPTVTSYTLGFGNNPSPNNASPTNPNSVFLSPDTPGNAAALVGSCNSNFQSNFNSGGTVASYLANAPVGCQTPNLADVPAKTLNPKYIEWNFQVQHSFGSRTAVSANYVGNRGYDEFVFNSGLNGFGFAGLPAAAPDSRVATVTQLRNAGISNYNGVTLSVSEQFARGFSGQFNYTYAHTLDDVSNGGVNPYSFNNSILTQINVFNLRALNYGAADYDLRHSLNTSYVWDLPFKSGNHLLNQAIGNWTVSGTFFYHTGFPFSVTDGGTTFGVLPNLNLNGGEVLAQPNGPITRTCTNQSTQCFTTANFGPSTSFGTLGRNSFRGPGYFNSDFSIKKAFHVKERLGLLIGLNAYNVFNHVNFRNPDSNLSQSTFGTITGTVTPPTTPYGSFTAAATDARIVQLTAKFTF